MHKEGDEVHETTTEARSGQNIKGMTLVLGGSIALIVVAFAVIVAMGWY